MSMEIGLENLEMAVFLNFSDFRRMAWK